MFRTANWENALTNNLRCSHGPPITGLIITYIRMRLLEMDWKQIHILIVHDEEDIPDVLRTFLETHFVFNLGSTTVVLRLRLRRTQRSYRFCLAGETQFS
jgi:hypothetical protein